MSAQDTGVVGSKTSSWQAEGHCIAALGRPFQLGMLYDCRTDTLVTGLQLWDKKTIEANTRTSTKKWSEVTMSANDDLDSKMFHVGASASITLSVLSGMVDVTGSANFLYNTKDSAETARISLKYSTTSRFEHLHISTDAPFGTDAKDHHSCTDVIMKHEMATHVVTGILYGADAFFVFDHKKKEDSSNVDVSGSLKAAVKGIPKIAIEGNISGGLNTEQKKIAENLNCTFYGDIILDPLPTTYKEALECYQRLPSLIGAGKDKDKTVPMKVWLLPLSALVSNVPCYVRHLNDMLLERALHVIEEFKLVEREATDLKKRITDLHDRFEFLNFILTRIEEFVLTVEVHRMNLASRLGELLPKLRGDSCKGDIELEDLLDEMTEPPFDIEGLRSRLDATEREAITLHRLFSLVDCDQTKSKTDGHAFTDGPGLIAIPPQTTARASTSTNASTGTSTDASGDDKNSSSSGKSDIACIIIIIDTHTI